MSRSELSSYLAYRNNIKRQLCIVGLWPREGANRFYYYLPRIFLILAVYTTLAIMGFVKLHIKNVALVTKGSSIMTSWLAVTLKISWVTINRDDASRLHNDLDPHFKKLIYNPISKQVLKGCATFQRLSWAYTYLVALTVLNFVATPVISMIYQYSNHINPIQYKFVYPTAYPWNIEPPDLRYKLHCIVESITTVPLFCVTVGVDSLFSLYGFQMVGQFREMSHRITNISDKTDGQSVVRECVRQHQKMMKCRDTFQKIYGPIILWIITTNAIILCSLIFQLTQTRSLIRVIFCLIYITLKLIQTIMYAWTGTSLTLALFCIPLLAMLVFLIVVMPSNGFRDAVYNANWHANKQFMTSTLIILTQKPLILTACQFSNVSLDLFIMVLNTTMSYFFLLRTFDPDV